MVLEIYQRLGVQAGSDSGKTAPFKLVLDHLQRDRGRLRTHTSDGTEVRIFLERGKPLQVGEVLQSRCGKCVEVAGAKEPVTTASCEDWFTFSRACYHLGNRHVKLQIGERWLRITPDHVLEEMLELLGLSLVRENAVFIPESGAYRGGHSHSHSHRHSHGHSHDHSHSDDHHEHHHH